MRIIIGHSNMDADCLGSVVLASKLFPDALPVRSSRMHPFARQIYVLYEDQFPLYRMADLPREPVSECVVVDTHALSQVREYLDDLEQPPMAMRAIDHHYHVLEPIPGPVELRPYGANCSILCEMLQERGLRVGPEVATIALAGIYADTGNFSHDNVKPQDYRAAEYLASCGASIRMVRKFTSRLPDDHLMNLFHEMLGSITLVQVQGLRIAVAKVRIHDQVPGLSLVAERLADVEQADGLFCVFELHREKNHLIIARSSHPLLDVAHILAVFGGGGHSQAASALIKKSEGIPVLEFLLKTIELRSDQADRARDLMAEAPLVLLDSLSLLEAALLLERHNHSGAPVVDAAGKLAGMLSLRDIQKGRKANAMHSPVRAYMTRKVLTVGPLATSSELEAAFMQHDINRLPVVDEGVLVGIIQRADCLRRLNGLDQ